MDKGGAQCVECNCLKIFWWFGLQSEKANVHYQVIQYHEVGLIGKIHINNCSNTAQMSILNEKANCTYSELTENT